MVGACTNSATRSGFIHKAATPPIQVYRQGTYTRYLHGGTISILPFTDVYPTTE